MENHFTEEEIRAEVRRLKAEQARKYAKANPEKRREYQARWWAKKAAASLAAREEETKNAGV